MEVSRVHMGPAFWTHSCQPAPAVQVIRSSCGFNRPHPSTFYAIDGRSVCYRRRYYRFPIHQIVGWAHAIMHISGQARNSKGSIFRLNQNPHVFFRSFSIFAALSNPTNSDGTNAHPGYVGSPRTPFNLIGSIRLGSPGTYSGLDGFGGL